MLNADIFSLFASTLHFKSIVCGCETEPFLLGNDTRQGGVLSAYLLSRYVRELLRGINGSNVGCNLGTRFFNIL